MDFEEIYRTYLQDVYRFLLKLCHDEQTAEELTQETFTRAYASIDSFRGTCKFSVWLCQIAKNTWFSYYERQKKSPPSALAEGIFCARGPGLDFFPPFSDNKGY